jgi:hypothetical protein
MGVINFFTDCSILYRRPVGQPARLIYEDQANAVSEDSCAAASGAGTMEDDGNLSSALCSSAGDRHDQNVLLKSGGSRELAIRVED